MTATETVAADEYNAYSRYLRGVEDRSPRTADSYSSYARTFTVWVTTTHPGLGFDQVTPVHVRSWLESQEQCGVTGKTNMHRWRHTYATTVLRSGSDVMAVQRLLGHRNIATTLGYLHLVDDDLLRAVDHAFPHAPTPDATQTRPGAAEHTRRSPQDQAPVRSRPSPPQPVSIAQDDRP